MTYIFKCVCPDINASLFDRQQSFSHKTTVQLSHGFLVLFDLLYLGMPVIPAISFNKLILLVESLGFIRIRQKGSHIRFSHSDGRKITIPDHGKKDVPKGLLVKIIRYDLKMEPSEFFKK